MRLTPARSITPLTLDLPSPLAALSEASDSGRSGGSVGGGSPAEPIQVQRVRSICMTLRPASFVPLVEVTGGRRHVFEADLRAR